MIKRIIIGIIMVCLLLSLCACDTGETSIEVVPGNGFTTTNFYEMLNSGQRYRLERTIIDYDNGSQIIYSYTYYTNGWGEKKQSVDIQRIEKGELQ